MQMKPTDGKATELTFDMPKECTINFNKVVSGNDAEKKAAGQVMKCSDMTKKSEVNTLSFKDVFHSDKGAYGILNVYAYSIFKVQEIKKISPNKVKTVSSIVDMLVTM